MAGIAFRNIYVNYDLVRGWSGDGVHVDWYNPQDGLNLKNLRIDNLWFFDFEAGFKSVSARQIAQTESNFNLVLSFLRDGENMLRRDKGELVGRNAFLFQYLRTPNFFKEDYAKCMGRKTLSFLSRYKGRDYFTVIEKDFEILKGHLAAMGDIAAMAAVESLDLEAALLYAPEGKKFVVGCNPVSTFNPFFEKRFASAKMNDKAYDIYGAVMVLPVSPEISIMLYDDSVYSLSTSDKIVLPENDVDLLNIAQIYNSDIDGGVVYSSLDTSYLDSLKKRLGNLPFREGFAWFTPERYPESMLLSVMSIREEAMKNLAKYAKAPLREYVKKVRVYDDELDDFSPDRGNHLMELMNYGLSLVGVEGKMSFDTIEVEEE